MLKWMSKNPKHLIYGLPAQMETRAQITQAAKMLGLESQIRLIEPHRYQGILERIVASRTMLEKNATSAVWLWESLREPIASTSASESVAVLEALVQSGEPVWFVAEADSTKKHGNFWLYESTIDAICAVLRALPLFEYYVVSKKLDWIVCENHHGQVIASGEPMASRLARMHLQGVG